MQRKKPLLRLFFLFFESFEIIDNVLDSDKSADIGVINGDFESFFAEHNEVCKFDGVDSEVCGKLGLKLNIVGVNSDLLDEERFELFKH